MTNLGRLQRADPREVWKSEAADFTPWLAENMSYLSEVVGLELEITRREASVGDFSVDILARDLGRDRIVIVENQLQPTDHGHLGQLITYAAGLDAAVVIWIARLFREEHRQALDWLNRLHEGRTEFYGVVLELLRVDESRPAVDFRLVAFPNVSTRAVQRAADGLSPKREAYRKFFQDLLDELRDKHSFTNARVAQPQNWYSFSAGVSGFSWALSFGLGDRVKAELYIDRQDAEENERILLALQGEREHIEKEFGETLTWETLDEKRACRVACYRSGTIEEPPEKLAEIRAWGVDRLLRFKRVFGPRLRSTVSRSV